MSNIKTINISVLEVSSDDVIDVLNTTAAVAINASASSSKLASEVVVPTVATTLPIDRNLTVGSIDQLISQNETLIARLPIDVFDSKEDMIRETSKIIDPSSQAIIEPKIEFLDNENVNENEIRGLDSNIYIPPYPTVKYVREYIEPQYEPIDGGFTTIVFQTVGILIVILVLGGLIGLVLYLRSLKIKRDEENERERNSFISVA